MTELPDGWEINHLEDLCEPGKQAIVDGPFGSNLKRSDYVDSGIPVLKIQNIKENVITLKKMDYVTPEKYEELNRHSFTEGDIVMTKLGDPLGVSAIVKGIPSGLIVADLVRIRPSKVITKFLCYQLNSPRIQKYINEQQKGTTRPRVNLAMIRELPIYSPPIDEQNKIVELLEDHLSRLDAALLEVKQAKIKAAQFRRSLLQAAFTGNLGSGGTSFKSKLPDGWETKRLDEIADIVMGQSPPGSSYNEHGEGQPFFQGKTEFGEVHPTVRKYTTAGTKFAKAGDILMSVRAPVGPTNIADIDCVIGRGLAAIRAKTVVSQDYLLWSLKHLEIDIQSKGTGTTFDAITGETLRGTLVALPPIDEQHKIVEHLQEHLSRLDASISLADSMERQSNGLRRSLLQAAFTGQLTKEVASV